MHFTMPVPPLADHEYFTHYQSFVRAMHEVRDELNQSLRVRKAMQMTADAHHASPSFIARLLVSFGLQGPENAFPQEFVAFVKQHDVVTGYFDFERTDYLEDLGLLWEYDEVNRLHSRPTQLGKARKHLNNTPSNNVVEFIDS